MLSVVLQHDSRDTHHTCSNCRRNEMKEDCDTFRCPVVLEFCLQSCVCNLLLAIVYTQFTMCTHDRECVTSASG